MRTIVVISDTSFQYSICNMYNMNWKQADNTKKTQIFSNSIRQNIDPNEGEKKDEDRMKEVSSSFVMIIHVEKKRKNKFRGIFTYQTGSKLQTQWHFGSIYPSVDFFAVVVAVVRCFLI